MPRRGLSNEDRLALLGATTSATSTIVIAPVYLYSVVVALNDTNATGDLVLSNTTGSAVADITADDFLGVRLGGGASGGTTLVWIPPKPLFLSKGLACSATNCEVSVAYLDGA